MLVFTLLLGAIIIVAGYLATDGSDENLGYLVLFILIAIAVVVGAQQGLGQ